ncbi:hypothetical protein CIPAW_15G166400 [Carya illinoinensis]|uniref:Uncharacterized protein n=1 Tax=Carya illinoinensis TaxID=32201 RepID=A0A8T1NGB4_CARIL|nr:hypothetical protein CIPAW_15G166400 [Carya illinoinensis]KAG6676399.1 hypothetical protein I3842_15G148800 [Carya illinoinensis]
MRRILCLSIVALLLFCQTFPSSSAAHQEKRALNPLGRAVGRQHLQQEETPFTDGSFYNRKLGVYIREKGSVGTRTPRVKGSSAVRNQLSSFHVASLLCFSLCLGLFM